MDKMAVRMFRLLFFGTFYKYTKTNPEGRIPQTEIPFKYFLYLTNVNNRNH